MIDTKIAVRNQRPTHLPVLVRSPLEQFSKKYLGEPRGGRGGIQFNSNSSGFTRTLLRDLEPFFKNCIANLTFKVEEELSPVREGIHVCYGLVQGLPNLN